MIGRLLIANRGEIACRIIRTCERLGVQTVAVYSDADAGARHVRLADEAVRIGGAAPAESYLDGEAILAAARARRVDAIHPGYGFLSENADFAAACAAAGIRFVGPAPETIRLMGSKRAARARMIEAGVPVVPGYEGEDQADATLAAAADDIGYPVMIKATAGGGGKGMRIVPAPGEFAEALAGARREAAASFGDDSVILEKYLEHPRHIEVQVFGDSAGEVLHLFERECSIQRRFQKVIEETPSPFLDDAERTAVAEAAVKAARAVDYRNAGTVEFIVSRDHEFFFMEMNTRLQVEHPVTEAVTGVDLVEWQLRAAAGEPLPATQADLRQRGHAVEARVYAENPFAGFLPSTGRVSRFTHPEQGRFLRVDAGVEDGDDVTVHYDPMIAKVIAWGDTRAEAVAGLRHALARTAVTGPTTNLPLLRGIAAHPAFEAGEMDTGFLDRHLDEVLGGLPAAHELALTAAACHIAVGRTAGAGAGDPWESGDGWQLGRRGGNRLRFRDLAGDTHEAVVQGRGGTWRVDTGNGWRNVTTAPVDGDQLEMRLDGQAHFVTLVHEGSSVFVGLDLGGYELELLPLYESAESAADADAHPGAPMPGRIVEVKVSSGDRVEPGQPLLVLEGMKMEFTLKATLAGTVARIHCAVGDTVEADTPLVDIDALDDEPEGPGA